MLLREFTSHERMEGRNGRHGWNILIHADSRCRLRVYTRDCTGSWEFWTVRSPGMVLTSWRNDYRRCDRSLSVGAAEVSRCRAV